MKAAIGLTKAILAMPFPWNLWTMLLAAVNMVGGIYFVMTGAGVLTLATLMGSFLIMTVIYAKRGFVRLLGLGHLIFWPPLLGYFLEILASQEPSGLFRTWLITILCVNGISLFIDLADLIRYVRGEREAL